MNPNEEALQLLVAVVDAARALVSISPRLHADNPELIDTAWDAEHSRCMAALITALTDLDRYTAQQLQEP